MTAAIAVAEEAVQDGFTVAVQRWPATGLRRGNYTGVIQACRAGTLIRRPSPPVSARVVCRQWSTGPGGGRDP